MQVCVGVWNGRAWGWVGSWVSSRVGFLIVSLHMGAKIICIYGMLDYIKLTQDKPLLPETSFQANAIFFRLTFHCAEKATLENVTCVKTLCTIVYGVRDNI